MSGSGEPRYSCTQMAMAVSLALASPPRCGLLNVRENYQCTLDFSHYHLLLAKMTLHRDHNA
jgi:hypothetical protein